MVRVGGFLKSQNRVRRQRARGRFISPYQVGGTIFGKSTTARYPLMHTSSRQLDRYLQRRMKGGTIFGTSTRMRMSRDPMKVLMADQEKARMERWLKQRMKGGTIFGKSTRRRQNPLGFTTAADGINPAQWRVEQALRRMKGGKIIGALGKGDLRKVLWANQAKARKQRQGIKRRRR